MGKEMENCMKIVVIAPYHGTNKAVVYLHLWCPYRGRIDPSSVASP